MKPEPQCFQANQDLASVDGRLPHPLEPWLGLAQYLARFAGGKVLRQAFVCWVFLGSAHSGLGESGAGSPDSAELRFAFSSRMFLGVNESDAKASVKAWALALARERKLRMDTQPQIIGSPEELTKSLLNRTIDGAAVTSDEYFGLDPTLRGTNLFVAYINGKCTEEYVVLVNVASGITNLAGLRGRPVTLFDSPRTALAQLWLDTILAKEGLGLPAEHFGQFTKAQKLTKVVLRTFFQQDDACVVNRRGFEIMCELNPQVRTNLHSIAVSTSVVPSLGFMRHDYKSPLRDALLATLQDLDTSPAGTQVLTLFQCDRLIEDSPAVLESARELVAAHQRLLETIEKSHRHPSGIPETPATPPRP